MFSNFRSAEEADKADLALVGLLRPICQPKFNDVNPMVPHYPGEVGRTDFQIAAAVLARTKRMEVGSAVMSILASGGPIAQAERVGAFLAIHGIDPDESRRLHIGFSAGRFEFMARPYGITPRNPIEEAAWPALRGQIFAEASEIFLRLLSGEVIDSSMIRETRLTRDSFRNDEDWREVQDSAILEWGLSNSPEEIIIPRRYEFESIATIPKEWRRDLLNLVLGSHDKKLQVEVNKWRPVQIFNLSITPPEIVRRPKSAGNCYLRGRWDRSMMPRTVMVFVNDEDGLSDVEDLPYLEESKSSISVECLGGDDRSSKLRKQSTMQS